MELLDKKVIVTGGASGFGLGIVKKFLNNGAKVVIADQNKTLADEQAQKLGSNAFSIETDVSNEESIENLKKQTKFTIGDPDILVNNAGITQDNLAIRMNIDEWKKVIDINLTSTFLLSKFAVKKMLKNKYGKIINITSVVGHTGNLGQVNYTASKAGIIAMSKSLAIEYAKKNININCISPGFIKTEMTDKIEEKFKEAIISKIPSSRLGEPEDVANAVLFLASDQSNYINGETIHVNGGMYMA